jgi:threonine synthase
MSAFADRSFAGGSFENSAYALRCRVCETVTEPEPLNACRRCDGPTDVAYDWERIERTVSRAGIAAGPESLWRYERLLPTAAGAGIRAGWTPLVRVGPLCELLGVDLLLKLEGANPTRSYKDRIAAVAVSAALEHGISTVCCSSTGNLGDAVGSAAAATGLEAMILAPAGVGAGTVAARHPGARVFAVDGTYDDCRRLELELEALFPWGFVSGNLHPYASEGAKTISFEIAEQLGWELPDAVVCPAASGMLFSKLAQGFSELTRAGLCGEPVPRLFAGQSQGSSPIADAFAGDRGISSVESITDVPSLAVGNPSHGDLALGAARATGGAVLAVSDEAISAHTALLTETAGIEADCAGGAAVGALVEAIRRGEIEPGARVVLVVSGLRPRVDLTGAGHAQTIAPEAGEVLTALGLES